MAEKTLIQQESECTVPSVIISENVESHVKPRVTRWMVVSVVTTMLGSCLPAGYCIGVINTPQEIIRSWVKSVILEKYNSELSLTQEVSLWSVIVAIFVAGATIGSSFGAGLADRIGRRASLLVNHWLCICSALLLMCCKMMGSVEMLIIGRFTSGICSGLATCLVPLYLSEVVTAQLRGVMAVTFPLGMCLGLFISQIMGMESVLELSRLHGDNKYVEAEESLLRMHAKICATPQAGKTWTISRVFKFHGNKMPLIITILFNAGQQFSGINAVFYYSTLIFRSAGLNMYQSQGASIGAGAVNCFMAILAVPLIKYCRRRVLLLTSVALCTFCQIVLMVALKLISTSPYAPFVAIAALLSFVLVYGMGLGPVPFMIATEMFPVGPRSIGISLGGTSNWFGNLVVGLTFPLIQESLGELSFSIFIASSFLLFIFIYKFLPETYGKEEILINQLEEEQESAEGTSTSSIEGPSYFV
ncbi:solute carrier family 2, facilitated glucose transporter member 7 isoform X4 [Cherax quadricarinatus]|uniref:solute carrier family 2, facilitated glucose transporter member 7 isoform X4 n=1 Tax=Cherax quadricarinatus TaxID=27406 RepID=UPI00387EBE30